MKAWPEAARIYLDESGICHKLARTHGYSPKGSPIHGLTYGRRKGRTNVIGAWSKGRKLFGTQTYEHTINKAVFIKWLKTKLCPQLEPGQIVIMDNAPWHKGNDIKALIEATGAVMMKLPKYSPDLNPIEQAWANLKAAVRKHAKDIECQKHNIQNQINKMNHSIRAKL